MTTQYIQTSPYYRTEMSSGYLGIMTFIDIPEVVGDPQIQLTSKYTYRPDLLAYDLYGDSRLWWVFASRNKDVIRDSIYDFVAGQTIFLPSLSAIKTAIGY